MKTKLKIILPIIVAVVVINYSCIDDKFYIK